MQVHAAVALRGPSAVSAYEIMRQVAKEHGVSVKDLRGPRRWSHIVYARTILAIELRHAGFSYPYIGRVINRHHATCMHLCGALGRQVKEKGNA